MNIKISKITHKCMQSTAVLLLCSILLSGCSTTLKDPVSAAGYHLNTYVQIDSYTNISKAVLNEGLQLCDTYEKLFSRTRTDSTLYQVNHQTCTVIPKELGDLIQYGLDYSEISGGAFDITIGSVSQLWDFTAEKPVVPNACDIEAALKYVNYKNVSLTKNNDDTYTISMPENTILDLGAIAKGYIADRLKDFLIEQGVTNAVINLGGNVLCIGEKSSSKDFNIGIKKPFGSSNEVLLGLKLNNISAVSSGTYERYFYENDTLYHHILNPNSGYPYETDITNVTILSDLSVIGDCLSTTCFVLGVDKGLELINSLENVEAVFVTKDGTLHYSDNIDSYLVK